MPSLKSYFQKIVRAITRPSGNTSFSLPNEDEIGTFYNHLKNSIRPNHPLDFHDALHQSITGMSLDPQREQVLLERMNTDSYNDWKREILQELDKDPKFNEETPEAAKAYLEAFAKQMMEKISTHPSSEKLRDMLIKDIDKNTEGHLKTNEAYITIRVHLEMEESSATSLNTNREGDIDHDSIQRGRMKKALDQYSKSFEKKKLDEGKGPHHDSNHDVASLSRRESARGSRAMP